MFISSATAVSSSLLTTKHFEGSGISSEDTWICCCFLVFLHNLQEVVDLKSWLEACHSIGWNRCGVATYWARYNQLSLLVSDHQLDKTLAAVDVVALE